MSRKRKLPVFYRIYFVCIAVFVLALVIGLIWLRGYLADYESAQPKYVAEEVFEKYYKTKDFDTIAAGADPSTTFEDIDVIAEYLHSQYDDDELTYSSVTTDDDSKLKYIVKSGDLKISSFILKKSGEKSKKGFDLYALDSFEIFYTADESANVLVPEGCTVYVNDVLLGEESIVEKDITDVYKCPEGVTPPAYVKYAVNGLIHEPTVSVKNGDKTCDVTFNEATGEYFAGLPNNEELKAEHADFVMKGIKEYAAYMQNDSWWGAVKVYLDPDSDLYESVYTAEQYFVIDHNGFEFVDEHIGDFFAYDENTFSCRVAFTQNLKMYGTEDYTDNIDMTVYLRRCGDEFRIFYWDINE